MESRWKGRRYYRCDRRISKVPGDERCECPSIDAPALEAHVWHEVVGLLDDSGKLEEVAAEWIGMAQGNQSGHMKRINQLDYEIGSLNSAIATVTATAEKNGRPPERVAEVTRTLNDELAQLKRQREEAASWLAEIQDAGQSGTRT
jgi:Recombinase zinc beta ribbon domain